MYMRVLHQERTMNYTTADLNQEITHYLYFNTGLLSFYLFLGLTGNISVLYIYTCKMKKTEERYFIPILAVADILACLAGIILGIVSNFNRANYVLDTFCKVGYFFTWATTSASGFMILLIALNRHLIICRPTSPQLTSDRKRRALIVMISIAVLISGPMLYFLGSRDVPFTYKGQAINATLCTFRFASGIMNQLQNTYFALQIFLAILNMVVTCGLYIPVGLTIYRRFKLIQQNMRFSVAASSESGRVPKPQVCDAVPRNELSVISYNSAAMSENAACSQIDAEKQSPVSKLKLSSLNRRKIYKRKRARYNFTLMFATIILVYVLAYLPTLILFMLPGSDPANFWFNRSGAELNVLVFLQRAFVLNNIVNPFIYTYFDLSFRNELLQLLCCFRSN